MAKLTSAARVTQSYLARKPITARLLSAKVGEAFPGGWVVNRAGYVITGKPGGEKFQLFANPSRAIEDFANTPNDPAEILRFTRRYGALHRNDLDWVEVVPGEKVVMGDWFFIHCDQWLQRQERFRAEWERRGKADEQRAEKLAASLAPGRPLGDAVRTFVRPRAKGFDLELQPEDLEAALWLAFLSVSDRTRKCQNPTCSTPYFLASRRDQKFCNEQCSRLVANRRWWGKHGPQWRTKNKRNDANKSKGDK